MSQYQASIGIWDTIDIYIMKFLCYIKTYSESVPSRRWHILHRVCVKKIYNFHYSKNKDKILIYLNEARHLGVGFFYCGKCLSSGFVRLKIDLLLQNIPR